jgi:fatty-acid desaturase
LSRAHEPTRLELVPDLAGYPELRLLDRWSPLGPLVMIAFLLALGGLHALLWGYAVSTCLLWHATFVFGSLSHESDISASYYVLRAMGKLGLVSGVRRLPDGADAELAPDGLAPDASAGEPAAS